MVSSINSSGPVQPSITPTVQNKQAEETATATGQKATAVIQPKTAVPATEKSSSTLPQELLSDGVKKVLQSASEKTSSGSATAKTSDAGPAPGEVDSDSEAASTAATADSGPAPGAVTEGDSKEASSSKATTYDSRDTNKDGKVSTNELLTASAKKKEADAG